MLSASVTTESLRQPRQERPRFVDQDMRRIDDEKPRLPQRLLAMRAGRPGANIKFEPQDVWRAERGDRVEKTGIASSVADRPPRDVSPGRPFTQGPLERAHNSAGFIGRLERRIDQDEAAALL